MASAVVVRGLAAGYGGLGLVGCDGMQALVSLSIRAITFSSPGKKEPTLSGRVGRSRFASSRCDGACAETEVNLSLSLSLSCKEVCSWLVDSAYFNSGCLLYPKNEHAGPAISM
jgi:hypothetical protein